MLENREELLDVIGQYFTIKPTDKDKVYNLYIADQCVGTLVLVVKGGKIKHGDIFEYFASKYGFTVVFEANFNYNGKDHSMYVVSGGKDEPKKKAEDFYNYCLLNRASSSYLHDCEE